MRQRASKEFSYDVTPENITRFERMLTDYSSYDKEATDLLCFISWRDEAADFLCGLALIRPNLFARMLTHYHCPQRLLQPSNAAHIMSAIESLPRAYQVTVLTDMPHIETRHMLCKYGCSDRVLTIMENFDKFELSKVMNIGLETWADSKLRRLTFLLDRQNPAYAERALLLLEKAGTMMDVFDVTDVAYVGSMISYWGDDTYDTLLLIQHVPTRRQAFCALPKVGQFLSIQYHKGVPARRPPLYVYD